MRTLTVLLVLLLAPASAGAAVFHVDDSVGSSAADCTVGICKTIADALTQSHQPAHSGPDTIQIAAGTYVEPLDLTNADDSGVVVQGAGDTTLIAPSTMPYCCAAFVGASVFPSQDAITVRGVKIVTPAAVATGKIGVVVNATNVVLDHVTVEMHNPGVGAAINLTGDHALLDHVKTTAAGTWSGPGVENNGGQIAFTVRDSDLAGGGNRYGLSTITAQMQPGPGSVKVERSILRAGPTGVAAANIGDVTAIFDSSLFLGGAQEAVYVSGANKPADVTLRNVTIDGGALGVADAGVKAIFASQQNAAVHLQSSIALEPVGTYVASTTIACTDSDVLPTSSATIDCGPGHGNSQHTPAELFGTGYELKTGSPAVDAGTPGALAAGESATDVGGLNRVVDATCTGAARRDRGAYELQAPPCPAAPPPTGGDGGGTPPPAATDTTAPKLTLKLKRRQRGRMLRVRARLDEAGTIRVKVAWGKKRKYSKARRVGAGQTVTIKLRLPRSAHRLRVTITAKDLAGNATVLKRTVRLLT
jgi:hypothetical protein